ncbi:MAG: NAD-dependent epimerase/dehydratase family protein [Gemmatimonadetes bacterium]|nr:NAD-dependent epimerase/dehydratase family protein [Gemmatimonadota bacterium]
MNVPPRATGDAAPPAGEAELEERLARPSAAVVEALRQCPGDVIVLGAGGKMGPSLVRMALRASTELGDGRQVIAVARWSNPAARAALSADGARVIAADLESTADVAALPDAPNVVYLAGQKFGTTDAPERTWALNTIVPGTCAERFPDSRWVAFSTGNVYPRTPVRGPHSREGDTLAPVGAYAESCVERERVLTRASAAHGTPMAIVRLNYAVDLRYGVLVDIARRVRDGEPVDVTMGWVNVIWQGDANRMALRLLAHAAAPPLVVNVTGPERLSVRELAEHAGARFGIAADIRGNEAPDALLGDTARLQSLLGLPGVNARLLMEWVASWLERRMPLLGKPTQFEVRDGRY